jgi:chaperonin cofactor prefoldin
VKELSKTIQDLKLEIETLKTSQRKTNLEMENVKRLAVTLVSKEIPPVP